MNVAEAAAVVRSKIVVDACQGISAAAWRDAGWQVRSLTGAPAADGRRSPRRHLGVDDCYAVAEPLSVPGCPAADLSAETRTGTHHTGQSIRRPRVTEW